jgi:hypothetical protein
MTERFYIQTVKRCTGQVLADYYETMIYDRQTGNMVRCAGDTPAESETNAKKYLDILNDLNGSRKKVEPEIDYDPRSTGLSR